MILSFEKKFSAKLGELNGKRLLVAFSGGKDSVSLLHFLKKNEGIKGYFLAACHVNHMFRKKAEWDEKFCSDFCEKQNIPFISYSCDVPRYCAVKKMSFEHGARVVRYRALEMAAEHFSADYIVTAHTKNDAVETFFIQAVQGASVFSLKGIMPFDGRILRPMLDISTDEIMEYLNKFNVPYVIDETNNDEYYLRNFIRKNIAGPLAEFRPGYEDNITSMLEDSVRFDRYMHDKLAPLVTRMPDGVTAISTETFDGLEDIEKEYLLHMIGSECFRFERRHITEMLKLIDNDSSVRADMPDNYKFEKSEQYLRLFHGRNIARFCVMKESGQSVVDVPHQSRKMILSGKWIDKDLTIRNRMAGDRFKGKKLKDIFIDKKLDLYTRDTALIIIDNNDIVWVENISHDATISFI